jgi:hypothetical protein
MTSFAGAYSPEKSPGDRQSGWVISGEQGRVTFGERRRLDEILRQTPLAPRSTADYQALLENAPDDEESHEGKDHGPDDSAA